MGTTHALHGHWPGLVTMLIIINFCMQNNSFCMQQWAFIVGRRKKNYLMHGEKASGESVGG